MNTSYKYLERLIAKLVFESFDVEYVDATTGQINSIKKFINSLSPLKIHTLSDLGKCLYCGTKSSPGIYKCPSCGGDVENIESLDEDFTLEIEGSNNTTLIENAENSKVKIKGDSNISMIGVKSSGNINILISQ